MKLKCFALIGLVSGCASQPVDPTRVSVVVEPSSVVCGSTAGAVPVTLIVKNASYGVLRIWIEQRQKPPYYLSWLSYKVLEADSEVVDWKHGPGGHGPMPPDTLHIGSGDSTRLIAELYDVQPKDYGREFRIRFKDEQDKTYTSGSFKPCILVTDGK